MKGNEWEREKTKYFVCKKPPKKKLDELCFNKCNVNEKLDNISSEIRKYVTDENVIVKFKTQGSFLSLKNNIDDSYERSIPNFSSDESSSCSSYFSSSSFYSDSVCDEELENTYLKEIDIDIKQRKLPKKCFTSFSENFSFHVKSSTSDFQNDSLFNSSNDFDDLKSIENNLKGESASLFNKENAIKRTNEAMLLMEKCIKLFSLNAYLYNDMFRFNPHLYGVYEKCRSNEKRCEHIADLCVQFDLVFLRSVYGKYQSILYEKLKNTHTILLDNCPLSSKNLLNEFFYTFQNYIGGNGGLFMCWKKTDFFLTFYDFIYLTSDILIKRKVIKLIKLKYKKRYDLYYVHTEFDLFSIKNKLSNLNDLIMLIKKTMWKIYVLRVFYKYKKLLRVKKNKKVRKKSMEDMNKNELIKQIHYEKGEIENISNSSLVSESNEENKKVEKKNSEYIHAELIFKQTSMFIIGSFNIDKVENREIYEKLLTLNNHGMLKDLFFYKNIHFKIQNSYNIVDRKNSLVGGLNYCFGLTDNIFILEQFFLNKESIDEMLYLFNPVDIIKEKLRFLKKSENNYHIENIFSFINRNSITFNFQNVFNAGVDILTQKKNYEFSDHWAMSAKFLLKEFSKKETLNIEQYLHNFFRNVDNYFVTNKIRYDPLCEVHSILYKKKKEFKEEDLKWKKYNYSIKCVVTEENIHTFEKKDKRLIETMKCCFGI